MLIRTATGEIAKVKIAGNSLIVTTRTGTAVIPRPRKGL